MTEQDDHMNVLRVPVVRSGAGALNRALFRKEVELTAAAVKDTRLISKYRKDLTQSNEILALERISPVAPHPDKVLAEQGRRCLLLNPAVNLRAPDTWGPVLKAGVETRDLGAIPYKLQLDYDYWTYHDIVSSILPEEFQLDIPAGFSIVGHVAHLNLREHALPYKKILAEVLMDKNPTIKTVINKIDNVGTGSDFRTFQYEVLRGPDDLQVRVSEGGCVFEFDYGKVYWNTRLETEHRRLISMFQPGEVVCDVMAGIGPFAVPAGKRGVFVWANDMNPESYRCMQHAIQKNKVQQYVRPFCEDGRDFIRNAADAVFKASRAGECAVIPSKKSPRPLKAPSVMAKPRRIRVPPTISHFVMNLPASAIEFLGSYRGIYAERERLFAPHTATKLPLVHVHCFSVKADDETPLSDICERITDQLGFPMKPGDQEVKGEVYLHDVRDVAPAKRMFCASFRLPREVAFAPRR